MLVQYNKQEFNQAQYGPYPVKVGSGPGHRRERAGRGAACPTHPVFNIPNKIGPEAWAGWVQERGTVLPRRARSRTTSTCCGRPIRSRYNPGAKTGALVEARVRQGALDLHRPRACGASCPPGTDGAYQLMANLLSLRKDVRSDAVRSPEYVACVLNENFEDAKAQFLAPLMRIHYAHLVMLDRAAASSRPRDAHAIRDALDGISPAARSGTSRYDGTCEDLFFYVERLIVDACGEEAAGRLHTARSRNDIDMTMYRMQQREMVLALHGRRGAAAARC